MAERSIQLWKMADLQKTPLADGAKRETRWSGRGGRTAGNRPEGVDESAELTAAWLTLVGQCRLRAQRKF